MRRRENGGCETAGTACRAGLLEQVCRITAENAKDFQFAKGLAAGTTVRAAYQRAARGKGWAAAAAWQCMAAMWGWVLSGSSVIRFAYTRR